MMTLVPPTRPMVCPLCPIHCDDVVVTDAGETIAGGCPIAETMRWQPDPPRTEPAGLAAIERADWVDVLTAGVDWRTARRLLRMRDAGKVRLHTESDPSIAAIGEATRRDGAFACTLAEVAVHADQVWTLGNHADVWPRLQNRFRRQAVLDRGGSWHHREVLRLEDLPVMIRDIEQSSQSADHLVFIIAPGAMVPREAVITAAMLGRWIRFRNRTHRASWLTLDAAATLQTVAHLGSNRGVANWNVRQNVIGVPKIRLGNAPAHDGVRVDLQIGTADPGASHAAMFWPAGVMGFHYASQVIRGDGSVTLPLHAVWPGIGKGAVVPPGPADVLSELLGERFGEWANA